MTVPRDHLNMAVVGKAVEPIASKPAFDKDNVIVIFVLGGPGAGESRRTYHFINAPTLVRERNTVRKARSGL